MPRKPRPQPPAGPARSAGASGEPAGSYSDQRSSQATSGSSWLAAYPPSPLMPASSVERLDQGQEVDLAFLARDLGYSGQAHFARDFRAAVGNPPAAYARTELRGRTVR
jgi:AraC-like DNA-binding protein